MSRLLPLLVLVAALSGCASSGGGGVDTGRFKGAQKDVATALDDLTDAARNRDGARVCAQLLSRRLVDALARGCRTAVDDQLEDADVFDLDVDTIRVTGNRAVAQVKSDVAGKKTARTLVLVREGARWRLDGVR